MRLLVTGSAGHLGEGLMRTLRASGAHAATGLDILPSPHTDVVGSITDRDLVRSLTPIPTFPRFAGEAAGAARGLHR